MEHPKTFRVGNEHLRLVQGMRITWDNSHVGAPCVDLRQPYTTGSGPEAVLQLAGVEYEGGYVSGHDGRGQYTVPDAALRLAWKLHQEAATALQIVLSTGSFKTGLYKQVGDGWQLV